MDGASGKQRHAAAGKEKREEQMSENHFGRPMQGYAKRAGLGAREDEPLWQSALGGVVMLVLVPSVLWLLYIVWRQ